MATYNDGKGYKLGTGAVTSAKISDGTIVNGDINASAGIAGSKLGTGAVMQIQYTQYTGTFTQAYTADTNETIGSSALIVNITPKSTSSIIKIDAHIFHEFSAVNTQDNHVWFFYRDSTSFEPCINSTDAVLLEIVTFLISCLVPLPLTVPVKAKVSARFIDSACIFDNAILFPYVVYE